MRSESAAESGTESGAGQHNAYVFSFATVRYRWHPLFGCQVRVAGVIGEGKSKIIRIEAPAGINGEIPAWMVEIEQCAKMSIGPPEVSLDRLVELSVYLRSLSSPAAGGKEDKDVEAASANDVADGASIRGAVASDTGGTEKGVGNCDRGPFSERLDGGKGRGFK